MYLIVFGKKVYSLNPVGMMMSYFMLIMSENGLLNHVCYYICLKYKLSANKLAESGSIYIYLNN